MAFRGFKTVCTNLSDGDEEGNAASLLAKGQQSPPGEADEVRERRASIIDHAFKCKGSERREQRHNDLQTSCQSSTHNVSSGQGDRNATQPLILGHMRKRSYSLPIDFGAARVESVEQHNTRTQAVAVLRSRTLSRLCESDRPSKEALKGILKVKLPTSSSEGPPDSMAFEKASIMDFVVDKKPKKKKNKSKKKQKKGNEANTEVSEPEAESKLLLGGVSKPDGLTSLPDKPKQGKSTKLERKSAHPKPQGSSAKQPDTRHSPIKAPKTPEPAEARDAKRSLATSTPKSTRTASSTFSPANRGTAYSPHTVATSEPPTGHRKKQDTATTPRLRAPSSPQAPPISTHAHPSPSSTRGRDSDIQTEHGHTITAQKPEGFFWQLDSHGFPCAKANCEKQCNLWDGATVICPRCGPYSESRYCSREHLFEDVKMHWISCGQNVFRHPCRESSIPKSVRDGPQLIPCLHPYDTPERHRQAVYFNMNSRAGDYFLFSDWTDMVEAGFPDDNLALRCSSRIIHVVKFTEPVEKDRFRRVLAACLFVTPESPDLADYLFRLIRDNLRNTHPENNATLDNFETSLKYQIHQELSVTIQPAITGKRHACETDWTGTNRRNCPDALCRSEYRRLLGSLGGRGHKALVEHLEASYWILRAARATHLDVEDVLKRMTGEGFEDVAEEDRRVFRRGDGWDGAGSGDMEVEGINA
ncbi:uncharacterized protein BJX67DRAFT_133002 [Aspergillus lucknowensis]|uniref:Uncharacterized protein n=1 Tax=Aspergillus lucknowensis TaxID=176173 RepID=A0ABR4LPX5_9EURO